MIEQKLCMAYMKKDLDNQLGQVPDDVYTKVQDGTDPGLDNMVRSIEENTREQLLNIQQKRKKKNHKKLF
jgi:hypothetical protein